MITTLTQFQTIYDVKDGEVASASVLSRPSDRLKVEMNSIHAAVEMLLGNYSLIPDWPNGSPYEAGAIVKHIAKFWKSLVDNNTAGPGTDGLKWEDITDLINALLALKNSGISGAIAEVIEAVNLAAFPVTGAASTIYIAKDTNIIYRWDGASYIALSGGSDGSGTDGTALVLGFETFEATSGQTTFTVTGDISNGVIVYVEGIMASASTYNVNTETKSVIFNNGLPEGTEVKIAVTSATVLFSDGFVPAERYELIAVGGQTLFNANYVPENVDVWVNGLKLMSSDFSATSGTSIVLDTSCTVGDEVVIMSYTSLDGAFLDDYVLKAGSVMTGPLTGLREAAVNVLSNDINLATGNLFYKTIVSETSCSVLNVPGSGQACTFLLELTNPGSQVINWFAGIKWADGLAPSLTLSGKDVLGFYTYDAGTTWVGMVLSKDVK